MKTVLIYSVKNHELLYEIEIEKMGVSDCGFVTIVGHRKTNGFNLTEIGQEEFRPVEKTAKPEYKYVKLYFSIINYLLEEYSV